MRRKLKDFSGPNLATQFGLDCQPQDLSKSYLPTDQECESWMQWLKELHNKRETERQKEREDTHDNSEDNQGEYSGPELNMDDSSKDMSMLNGLFGSNISFDFSDPIRVNLNYSRIGKSKHPTKLRIHKSNPRAPINPIDPLLIEDYHSDNIIPDEVYNKYKDYYNKRNELTKDLDTKVVDSGATLPIILPGIVGVSHISNYQTRYKRMPRSLRKEISKLDKEYYKDNKIYKIPKTT